MKKISHKTSARLRTPTPSLAAKSRLSDIRGVSVQQLLGANPLWYVDYNQTSIAEGGALVVPPQRKAVSWITTGPAGRAAWTSDGMEFAGAQSYGRGSGTDVTGQTQVSVITVYNKAVVGAAILLETNNAGFFATRGIIQAIGVSGPGVTFNAEGPTPTNVRETSASIGVKTSIGTYWDTANPVPADTILTSTNGQDGDIVASAINTKGTAFTSNSLWMGSRAGTSVFWNGFIKVQIFFRGASNQSQLNNLTRVAQWSVK